MKPVRDVALVGLGAIGILYAGQISARDPRCLRVVADPARLARYRADPPALNGRRLDLNYATPDEFGAPADLVLVAVKSTGLAAALPVVAPLLGPDTQILPLLNGITAQDVLAEAFGWPRVLYGFVYCSSAMRTGNSVVQAAAKKSSSARPSTIRLPARASRRRILRPPRHPPRRPRRHARRPVEEVSSSRSASTSPGPAARAVAGNPADPEALRLARRSWTKPPPSASPSASPGAWRRARLGGNRHPQGRARKPHLHAPGRRGRPRTRNRPLRRKPSAASASNAASPPPPTKWRFGC
jgi:hypothetical protein